MRKGAKVEATGKEEATTQQLTEKVSSARKRETEGTDESNENSEWKRKKAPLFSPPHRGEKTGNMVKKHTGGKGKG